MKGLKYILILLTVSILAAAQTPTDLGRSLSQQWAGAGLSYNQFAAPQLNGFVVYARRIVSGTHPTYSFSAIDFVSVRVQPFQVATTTETGVAQHVIRFGKFDVFGIGTLGLAAAGTTNGTNIGGAFGAGGLALTQIKGGWSIGPLVRIFKSALSERQWSAGLILGWGQ
jgi:hypothetical protein